MGGGGVGCGGEQEQGHNRTVALNLHLCETRLCISKRSDLNVCETEGRERDRKINRQTIVLNLMPNCRYEYWA